MAKTDPDRERQRLEALYSQMSEDELRAIAEDTTSLTGEALEALKAVMRQKKMEISVPQPQVEVAYRSLVTVREFRDLPDAELAKGLIESAGIEAFLADDNIVRMDWFYSNAVGGIKLQVKREDAAAAIQALDQPIPENFEVEGVGDYQQPKCPQCGSMEVSFFPVDNKAWKCDACGHAWEDTEPKDG